MTKININSNSLSSCSARRIIILNLKTSDLFPDSVNGLAKISPTIFIKIAPFDKKHYLSEIDIYKQFSESDKQFPRKHVVLLLGHTIWNVNQSQSDVCIPISNPFNKTEKKRFINVNSVVKQHFHTIDAVNTSSYSDNMSLRFIIKKCLNLKKNKKLILYATQGEPGFITVSQFLPSLHSTDDIVRLLSSVFLTLLLANQAFGFVHGDLHLKNILINPSRLDESVSSTLNRNTSLSRPSFFFMKLFDFDYSVTPKFWKNSLLVTNDGYFFPKGTPPTQKAKRALTDLGLFIDVFRFLIALCRQFTNVDPIDIIDKTIHHIHLHFPKLNLVLFEVWIKSAFFAIKERYRNKHVSCIRPDQAKAVKLSGWKTIFKDFGCENLVSLIDFTTPEWETLVRLLPMVS